MAMNFFTSPRLGSPSRHGAQGWSGRQLKGLLASSTAAFRPARLSRHRRTVGLPLAAFAMRARRIIRRRHLRRRITFNLQLLTFTVLRHDRRSLLWV